MAMSLPAPVLSSLVRSPQDIASARGALFLDRVPQFGPWRILLSSRANRDLRWTRSRKPKTFKSIVNKIKDLSTGQFDVDKRLHGDVAIFQASAERGTNIVYRVDCFSEHDSDVESQVIAIYGVYSDVDVSRKDFWDSVAFQISRRGPDHRERCTLRRDATGLFVPQDFPAVHTLLQSSTTPSSALDLPEHHMNELQELLVLQRLVPFSQAVLNSMLAEVDVTLPFSTSSAETKIIDHPGSCYVIGRSGTGKTTTVLFRMLARERAGQLQYTHERLSSGRPRQLFVTQSRVHAGQVEDSFRRMISSLEATSMSPKQLKQKLEASPAQREDLILPTVNDDNNTYRADLPRRFSELKDEHFPLFVTIEKLVQMLEEDVRVSIAAAIEQPPTHPAPSTTTRSAQTSAFVTQLIAGKRAIGYGEWLAEYWNRFPDQLVKNQDAALVYSEIMGVIKGSEEALHREDRFLDLATYERLGKRRQTMFANQRKRVYDVFAAYRKEKQSKGHIDTADRAHALLELIQNEDGLFGQPVDFLYVDEAQDNLLMEALILRTLCSNPDGLFWAGDTAQTLSIGSSFRFNDLKAFLHRVEERRLTANPTATPASEPPIFFHLAVNYRSHAGIIQCARSVIDVITSFWPDSIDSLPEESAIVEGRPPVFITIRDGVQHGLDGIFGPEFGRVSLGARQAVLVRDAEAKERFARDVGRIGLVFTIAEAKGMEFDDVILFDFFSDSDVSAQNWRVVLNELPDKDKQAAASPAPTFNPIRHAVLCAELKALYVALTRARKNLWIIDHSDCGEPMRMLWSSRGRVNTLPHASTLPNIANDSAPEEWRDQAYIMFKHGCFFQAAYCFERGGEPHRAAAATAYHMQSVADGGGSGSVSEQTHAAVGEAFEAIALPGNLDFNLQERTAYLKAAGHSLRLGDTELSARAALCFELAGDYIWAVKLHVRAKQFDHAAYLLRKHDLSYEDAEIASVFQAVGTYYIKRHDARAVCQLFDDPDDALEFFAKRGTGFEHAEIMVHLGHWVKAAEFYMRQNMPLVAADLYLNDRTRTSSALAFGCVRSVLQGQTIDEPIDPNDSDVQEIERLLSRLQRRGLKQHRTVDIFYYRLALADSGQQLARTMSTATIQTAYERRVDFYHYDWHQG